MPLDREDRAIEQPDPDDVLGTYFKSIKEIPFLERSQELRAATITHAGESLQEWRENIKCRHVWEEVYIRLFRAWEDVQTYCSIHSVPPPKLSDLLIEGATLSEHLLRGETTSMEKYLDPLGWQSHSDDDESEESIPVMEIDKLSRPIFCIVESAFLLPPDLQTALRTCAMQQGRLPDLKNIEPFMQRWGIEDLSGHERALQEKILEARSLLVLTNTRFAVERAKKFQSDRVSLADRIQEANIGLLKAAYRFQPHRGRRFKTAAGWSVFSELQRKCNRPEQTMYSLDAPLQEGDPESGSLGERLQYEMPDPEERAYQLALHDIVEAVLKMLPERDRQLIIMRYGLDGGPPYDNKEIGDILNLTKERVRQLLKEGESRAVRQIARRFPHILPPGMTPQMALTLADGRDAKLPKNRQKSHTIDPTL